MTTATSARASAARQRQSIAASSTAAAMSAAKLDCENENTSPAHTAEIAAPAPKVTRGVAE
jgi:hypothetical protein